MEKKLYPLKLGKAEQAVFLLFSEIFLTGSNISPFPRDINQPESNFLARLMLLKPPFDLKTCVRVACVCVCACLRVCACVLSGCEMCLRVRLLYVCEGEEWAWVVVRVGCVGVSLFCVFALQGPVPT